MQDILYSTKQPQRPFSKNPFLSCSQERLIKIPGLLFVTITCKKKQNPYVIQLILPNTLLSALALSFCTANPVWLINSRKSFSIESILICNYMFLNRIKTFFSNGFCWAGSSNARQKHIFPNRIIKLQLENYNSFPNYAKTYTMSEVLGRQTPTAVALEYTVLSIYYHIHTVGITIFYRKQTVNKLGQFTIFIVVGR